MPNQPRRPPRELARLLITLNLSDGTLAGIILARTTDVPKLQKELSAASRAEALSLFGDRRSA